MMKKLYEYELIILDRDEDDTSKNARHYFTDEVAKDHNKQYAINDVPRKLVKVEGGDVIEKPDWWSGNIK